MGYRVEIILLIFLIVLNGLFAMSEIALVTARKGRLLKLAEEGDRAAATAIQLGAEPTRFLSTVQIGITAIGVTSGIVGESALARPLAGMLHRLGLDQQASSITATTLAVVVITYMSIVIGELVPKRIGQNSAEDIARSIALPIGFLSRIAKPFVILLMVSTDLILRGIGKQGQSSSSLTEEDIHALMVEGSETGVIKQREHEMLRNVFRFDDRHIVSMMTPRSEVIYLDIDQPLETSLPDLLASEHSRFPVCRGGLREILGVISVKRLLKLRLAFGCTELLDCLQAPVYAPESLTALNLMEQFRESGVHMVFVVDEYGEMLGIVTLQDMLEVLTGEFRATDVDDIMAVQRDDGSWLLDGLLPIHELQDILHLKSLPKKGKIQFHTLGGLILCLMGRIPRTGESTSWQDWRFEVVDLDGNRIDKILASRIELTDINRLA
jgi:putative hemolysin